MKDVCSRKNVKSVKNKLHGVAKPNKSSIDIAARRYFRISFLSISVKVRLRQGFANRFGRLRGKITGHFDFESQHQVTPLVTIRSVYRHPFAPYDLLILRPASEWKIDVIQGDFLSTFIIFSNQHVFSWFKHLSC